MTLAVSDASPLIALNQIGELRLLEAVRPHVEALVRGGLYATPALVERILRDAGEAGV